MGRWQQGRGALVAFEAERLSVHARDLKSSRAHMRVTTLAGAGSRRPGRGPARRQPDAPHAAIGKGSIAIANASAIQ